jgi:hypothetical protein
MTNDKRNPKRKCRKVLCRVVAAFVIWNLSFLRILSFVLRICEARFMASVGLRERVAADVSRLKLLR